MGRRIPVQLRTISGLCHQRVAGFKHLIEANGALRRHRFPKWISGEDYFDAGRLAVIPLDRVTPAIRADDAVLGGDFMPELSLGRSPSPDAIHVHCQTAGVERVEFADKAPNA